MPMAMSAGRDLRASEFELHATAAGNEKCVAMGMNHVLPVDQPPRIATTWYQRHLPRRRAFHHKSKLTMKSPKCTYPTDSTGLLPTVNVPAHCHSRPNTRHWKTKHPLTREWKAFKLIKIQCRYRFQTKQECQYTTLLSVTSTLLVCLFKPMTSCTQ